MREGHLGFAGVLGFSLPGRLPQPTGGQNPRGFPRSLLQRTCPETPLLAGAGAGEEEHRAGLPASAEAAPPPRRSADQQLRASGGGLILSRGPRVYPRN